MSVLTPSRYLGLPCSERDIVRWWTTSRRSDGCMDHTTEECVRRSAVRLVALLRGILEPGIKNNNSQVHITAGVDTHSARHRVPYATPSDFVSSSRDFVQVMVSFDVVWKSPDSTIGTAHDLRLR